MTDTLHQDITTTDTYQLVTAVLQLPTELQKPIWQKIHYFSESEPKCLSRLFTEQELDHRKQIPVCNCLSRLLYCYTSHKHYLVGIIPPDNRCIAAKHEFHYCLCKYIKNSNVDVKTYKCLAKSHTCICSNLEIHLTHSYITHKYNNTRSYRCIYKNICLAEVHKCRCQAICIDRHKNPWHKNNIVPCLAPDTDHDPKWHTKLDSMNGIYRSELGSHRLRKPHKPGSGTKAMYGKNSRKKGGDFRL